MPIILDIIDNNAIQTLLLAFWEEIFFEKAQLFGGYVDKNGNDMSDTKLIQQGLIHHRLHRAQLEVSIYMQACEALHIVNTKDPQAVAKCELKLLNMRHGTKTHISCQARPNLEQLRYERHPAQVPINKLSRNEHLVYDSDSDEGY
jgi:hypothetical protein